MLIKLTDTKGNIVYVNPDHVVMVTGGSSNGATVVNEAAVVVAGVGAVAAAGSPSEIADTLNGVEPKSRLL